MILTLFGYPKTGKTLIFNLLTDKQEEVSKFSASGDTLHKAVVDVPDERLLRLAQHLDLPPVYARLEYLDTGALGIGAVKDATFIDMLRRADGLVHVVRGFRDPEIPHPQGSVDPSRDIASMEEELLLVDLISIEKRLERLAQDLKKMKSKELEEEQELLLRLKEFIEKGEPLRRFSFSLKEERLVRGFAFLTLKPLIHLVNADENTYTDCHRLKRPAEEQTVTRVFCGKMESELLALDADERAVFQEEYGLRTYDYLHDQFVRTSYAVMNLISFFTVGKDETRAWTITSGSTAVTAAGKIHTDMQAGFIRAEVIHWKDFLDAGGFAEARDQGRLRLEGKAYVIQDGDVVNIRFNR